MKSQLARLSACDHADNPGGELALPLFQGFVCDANFRNRPAETAQEAETITAEGNLTGALVSADNPAGSQRFCGSGWTRFMFGS